jgi:secreted Zn-dependent insulinase-like peptidase
VLFSLAIISGCATSPAPAPLTDTSATDVVVKSPNDQREYAHVTLDNGMRVLLISDPDADKSAAALVAFRGNFHDPKDRPGLAHFLEHMLFIGTEKYPEPDGYFAFVKKHGGGSNAYTAPDHTNYFFDIQPEYFVEGLDRFAQFFISPLLDKAYVDREKNAVHSEYQMQIKEDGWRGFMVQKVAMNPEHPISKFSIGTLDTLDGDAYSALITFFEGNYSANQMGAVILHNESIATLKPWVTELLGQVPNRNLPSLDLTTPLTRTRAIASNPATSNLKVRSIGLLCFSDSSH